jgi:hypothetical protein
VQEEYNTKGAAGQDPGAEKSSSETPKLSKAERKAIERKKAIEKAAQEAREKAGIEWELEQGDDVEIAECIAQDLLGKYGEIVYAEGDFWRYRDTHWVVLSRSEIRKHAHRYSGLFYGTTGRRLQLNRPRLDSIIYELSVKLAQESKFVACSTGVNCLDGFVVWADGQPTLVPHSPHHLQRHALQGHWDPKGWYNGKPLPENSYLSRLLTGCFRDEPQAEEILDLLQELAGAIVSGHGTKLTNPKAIVLKGEKADNGKSQILDLLEGLLPSTAISHVSPSSFGDGNSNAQLIGKLLNIKPELGTAKAIASDDFKSAITGEPLTAKLLFQNKFSFVPRAQHVFACNLLPSFHGGMDQGVIRRLLVIPFNRRIPESERIYGIGKRIVHEEMDLLLAWAIDGATRLMARGIYPEPEPCKEALRDWKRLADPALEWLDARVLPTHLQAVEEEPAFLSQGAAYDDYKQHAKDDGGQLLGKSTFLQRVRAALPSGITWGRSRAGRGFSGMKLRPPTVGEILRAASR